MSRSSKTLLGNPEQCKDTFVGRGMSSKDFFEITDEVQTVQAVELDGVRDVADHSCEVADGECRQHIVAWGEHVLAGENGDDKQTADDADGANDDADVAVVATVLELKFRQQTLFFVRLYFRCPRNL